MTLQIKDLTYRDDESDFGTLIAFDVLAVALAPLVEPGPVWSVDNDWDGELRTDSPMNFATLTDAFAKTQATPCTWDQLVKLLRQAFQFYDLEIDGRAAVSGLSDPSITLVNVDAVAWEITGERAFLDRLAPAFQNAKVIETPEQLRA
jgi:hypothetical protein